ncbi:MAG: hypothetical protein MZV64_23710 [Ignavibacteriales bacterium]|nr:hypothetical protein [Ignavibacteriales bacterium]
MRRPQVVIGPAASSDSKSVVPSMMTGYPGAMSRLRVSMSPPTRNWMRSQPA